MLIAFSVVIVTLSLEAWIFYVYSLEEAKDLSAKIQIALGVIMIILINAIAFYLPMRIGKKKLQEHTGIL